MASAQAAGKAIRQPLLQGLEMAVPEGVAGARRGLPLELPSLTVQAFVDYAHYKGISFSESLHFELSAASSDTSQPEQTTTLKPSASTQPLLRRRVGNR